jgi:hypothetical protein
MKILLAILIFFASQPVVRAEWLPREIHEVRAYVYDFTVGMKYISLLRDGKLHPGVINTDGAKLSDDQTKRLLAALQSTEERAQGFRCYSPHHGFVFFDEEGHPMGHIELCFQCGNVQNSPEGLPEVEWNWAEIKKLLVELKIPLLKENEDYTKLYEESKKKIENKAEMATPRKPSD